MTTQLINTVSPSVTQSSTFIINPKTSQSEAIDTLYMLLAQADASVTCLLGATDDGKEFNLSYTTILNVLWAVQTQIETAQATLNHMVKVQKGGNHV
jgi:steroid 5-alpha reductase family enzyme